MQNVGLDVLGLQKYPDLIKHWPSGFACGVFDTEFGDVYKTVTKLLASGKCPLLRVNLLWSSTHTYGDKDIPAIKKRSPLYELLKQKYPDIIIEIAPFTESNLRTPDQYLEIVKEYAPSCTPVNSIWKGNLSKYYKNEIHGSKARVLKAPYNFSYDGNSANNADVEKHKELHKNCDTFFFWTAAFNGKAKDDEKLPIEKRKHWPTHEHLEATAFLATGKHI